MPKFTVEHQSTLDPQQTFEKVKDYLEHSGGLRKMDADLKCTFDSGSMTGQVKGSKFDCDVKVSGSDKGKVELTINIGFLLTPFKGQIQDHLKKKMTEILG